MTILPKCLWLYILLYTATPVIELSAGQTRANASSLHHFVKFRLATTISHGNGMTLRATMQYVGCHGCDPEPRPAQHVTWRLIWPTKSIYPGRSTNPHLHWTSPCLNAFPCLSSQISMLKQLSRLQPNGSCAPFSQPRHSTHISRTKFHLHNLPDTLQTYPNSTVSSYIILHTSVLFQDVEAFA